MLNSGDVRLKEHYLNHGVSQMVKEHSYKNVMQVPRLVKIVISMGMKEALIDSKVIDKVKNDLLLISGQMPVVTYAKRSIAGFKLREGAPLGCKVTLRSTMMYEFLDRLVNIALPRVRDFSGFSSKQFDSCGNFNFGLKEQIVFPEIIYDEIDKIRGMNVTVVTSARTDAEALSLLKVFNVPFLD